MDFNYFNVQLDLHLIQPLWMMVNELLRRQEELKKIIVSKDREIDDYKSTGARCSRSNIAYYCTK